MTGTGGGGSNQGGHGSREATRLVGVRGERAIPPGGAVQEKYV